MDEIIDYVVKTPQDTNPNVLRDMLNNLSSDDWLTVNVYQQLNPEAGAPPYITDFDTVEPIVRAMPFVEFVYHLFDRKTGEPLPLESYWPDDFYYIDDESVIVIHVDDWGYNLKAENIHSPLVGYV